MFALPTWPDVRQNVSNVTDRSSFSLDLLHESRYPYARKHDPAHRFCQPYRDWDVRVQHIENTQYFPTEWKRTQRLYATVDMVNNYFSSKLANYSRA